MLIEDIIDEYDTNARIGQADILGFLRDGNRFKDTFYKKINTPLQDFTVRFDRDRSMVDYYLYEKEHDKCIGVFSIEDMNVASSILAPGIRTVSPHMVLHPDYRKIGIATKCYTTFLMGGPWVFATDYHSQGAKALWDSLSRGPFITVYYDESTRKVLKTPQGGFVWRLMGPKNRFNID